MTRIHDAETAHELAFVEDGMRDFKDAVIDCLEKAVCEIKKARCYTAERDALRAVVEAARKATEDYNGCWERALTKALEEYDAQQSEKGVG